jgi:hypothetical protein
VPSELSAVSVATESTGAAACLNCGQLLDGPFCSKCGQRALPAEPTAREFIADAYTELAGWDGKVARTIHLLIFRPGELTHRILEGHRTSYITAVKLYLMCSLVYFLVAAGAPVPDVTGFEVTAGATTTGADAALAKALTRGSASLTSEERAALDAEIAAQPLVIRPILREAARDLTAFRKRVGEATPRALFALVPVLALMLALFHRRRTFPVHLYVATHFQAFGFLVMTLAAAVQYTGSVAAVLAAMGAIGVWMLVHAAMAQRRVYGGTWGATVLKTAVIAALFLTAWSATTLAVSVWVAL